MKTKCNIDKNMQEYQIRVFLLPPRLGFNRVLILLIVEMIDKKRLSAGNLLFFKY